VHHVESSVSNPVLILRKLIVTRAFPPRQRWGPKDAGRARVCTVAPFFQPKVADAPEQRADFILGEAIGKVKVLALRVIADEIEHGERSPEIADAILPQRRERLAGNL
jgi:hypothetical protein